MISCRSAGGALVKWCFAVSDVVRARGRTYRHGAIEASLVSAACFLRGVPLFLRAVPRTPLRVLGIVALDTLYVLRHSQPLPRPKIQALALFLDFQGCANATWDRKVPCESESRAIRHQLDRSGLRPYVEEYLRRLQQLESRRPSIGGDRRRFDEVRIYREEVARLSIATAAAIALNPPCRSDDIRAASGDGDIDILFRVLMQCQIIDDVLDYREDRCAGLPSFMTASASLTDALEWTATASRGYGSVHWSGHRVFPLRVALAIITAATRLIVRLADRWHIRINSQMTGNQTGNKK